MRYALLLFALLFGSAANAQVLYEDVVVQVGLVCDTEDEVRQFVAVLEASNVQEALQTINGCGLLKAAVRTKIEHVSHLSTSSASYQIISYEFIEVPLPKQFGIGAYKKLSQM